MFRVGDLVTESDRSLWYFGFGGYHDSYWGDWGDSKLMRPKRSQSEPIIGFVIEVIEKHPTELDYHVTAHHVYRVKWLNPPQGNWQAWRHYYEEELNLISAIEILGEVDDS